MKLRRQPPPAEFAGESGATREGGWRHWMFHPEPYFSRRVAHAGFWALVTRVLLRFSGIVKIAVLARLLAPNDFGLMAIAMLLPSFLANFSQTGFRSALVQRKDTIHEYLDTAWTVGLLRGIGLAVVIFLLAPLVGKFFDAHEAVLVVRVMALAPLLQGLTNVGVVYFRRDLEFHKRFQYRMAEMLAEVVVVISMALLLHSVWALVYGILAGRIATVLASYLLHPYRPRLRLDWAKARELYKFGRWIFLNQVMTSLALRGDVAVVARMLGPIALGIYEFGRRLADITTKEISGVASTVAFPAYARIQEDLSRLKSIYIATLEVVAAIAFPSAIFVFLLGESIVRIFLGEQWIEVASVLPPLAIAGCLQAVSNMGGALQMGTGRPVFMASVSFLRISVMFTLMVPLTNLLGISGAALAVLAGSLTSLPTSLWYSARLLRVNVLSLVHIFFPAAFLSGVVAVSIVAIRVPSRDLALAELVIVTALGGAGYLAASLLLWRLFRSGPLRIFILLRARRDTEESQYSFSEPT